MMLVAVALAIVLVVGITWVVASRRALVGQLSRMSSSFGHAALEPAATLDEERDQHVASLRFHAILAEQAKHERNKTQL